MTFLSDCANKDDLICENISIWIQIGQNWHTRFMVWLLACKMLSYFYFQAFLSPFNGQLELKEKQQVSSKFLPHVTSAPNLGNLHFLSSESPAVHGGPGEAGGVGVSPAVRCWVISMEAVSTDEHVASETWTRQIGSRITSWADGGQSWVGAVHTLVSGVILCLKERLQSFVSSAVHTADGPLPSRSPVAQIMVCCEQTEAGRFWRETTPCCVDEALTSRCGKVSTRNPLSYVTIITLITQSHYENNYMRWTLCVRNRRGGWLKVCTLPLFLVISMSCYNLKGNYLLCPKHGKPL